MKVLVVITLIAVGACTTTSTEGPPQTTKAPLTTTTTTTTTEIPGNSTTPSGIAFSPFLIYDGRYALGTFAKVNWYQAQATCASHGYTLASINSEIDQRRLRNFFYTRGHSQLHLLNEPIWISGTDLADRNNWIWFSNGRTFTYRNFQSGSPVYSPVGTCLGVNGITSLWVNENCQNLHYFACELRCIDGEIY